MRIVIAAVLVAAGCGKELNPAFCDAHPGDDRCLGAAADVARDAPRDTVSQCPTGYDVTVTGSTSKYRIVDALAVWADAEADCADDGATTHLAVVDNDAELQALAPHIDRERFIGHSDRIAEGTWVPVTDQPNVFPALAALAQPPWAGGEPDGSGDCGLLAPTPEVRDRDCASPQAYLCECDLYPANPSKF